MIYPSTVLRLFSFFNPTDDYDTHPSNQAKAENQQDQHVEKGKKIESLFTNDGEAKLKPICISSLV